MGNTNCHTQLVSGEQDSSLDPTVAEPTPNHRVHDQSDVFYGAICCSRCHCWALLFKFYSKTQVLNTRSDIANDVFSISNEIMAVETCSLRAVKCSTNKIKLLYLMYAKETIRDAERFAQGHRNIRWCWPGCQP